MICATADRHSNALTLTASAVAGEGIADVYTGLNGGIGFPAPPNPTNASPAPTYNSTIDAGIVSFDNQGNPKLVAWQSMMVGLQYYTPIDNGHVWISGNYSRLRSPNTDDFSTMATASRILASSQFVNADLFWDATPQIRFGLDFSWFQQKYVDNVKAYNKRVQFSGFYLF